MSVFVVGFYTECNCCPVFRVLVIFLIAGWASRGLFGGTSADMMMRFKSAIQWSLYAPIILLLLGLGIFLVFMGTWFVLAVNLLCCWLILSLITATDYTIHEGSLLIRSGFLFRLSIPLTDIRKIKPSSSILSAPAASLKGRLEIYYGKGSQVIISPKDQKGFLDALLAIHPDIELPQDKRWDKS